MFGIARKKCLPNYNITGSTFVFVLLVVGVVWKVNVRPLTSTPRGAKTSRGIELQIGRINYIGGLTNSAKFQICKPTGVVWAIG